MVKEQRYMKALEWIHGLGRFGIRPGLERVTALLEMLGNPHHEIKYVHIGGTNGKGSTAAMLASILRKAGYRVGLYTSPYLLSFTNRMAINGSDIEHDELVELVDLVQPLVDEISSDPQLGPLTEFEVVTALALTYFAREKVDLVVLEVGLGGRLDATNVINPLLSIVTNVSLEHTDVLGDTVEAIAAEKAGIIKQGRPLITAAENLQVLQVLQDRCARLDAPFHHVINTNNLSDNITESKSYVKLEKINEDGQLIAYRGFELQVDELFIPLRGRYQVINAAAALNAVELLKKEGFSVDLETLRLGLADTDWPGRLEVLSKKPFLIVDGAHNPEAIKSLADSFPHYFKFKHLVLVVGMLADKDTGKMLKDILPLASKVIFTRPKLPRAANPKDLADYAVNNLNMEAEYYVVDDHGNALDKALKIADPGDAVLVTGSLYTVSDIRAYWQKTVNI